MLFGTIHISPLRLMFICTSTTSTAPQLYTAYISAVDADVSFNTRKNRNSHHPDTTPEKQYK